MRSRNWNEYSLNPLTRINWRASLVPAAAVIPAPIAYIKVVVVKKLVVGSQLMHGGPLDGGYCHAEQNIALVLKAGINRLNTVAWNNGIGPWFCSVGLRNRAKAFVKNVFINQERKLEVRRRSDTALVLTINDANQQSARVYCMTRLAASGKPKFFGSRGSMVAKLKLKGIDGRAPPGVEPAA
ncbi:hypothetical protein DERF_000832 [Dermatophagoides farinae]|uniref:Uncharacterized protein n=1 Tax=Dermatophagoides farinae TaxID=6954 RepID=A0A922HNH1_DERFA|nr:hypothetical protein DERF_014876 [Dermatophagoides farinae]KAH9498084.1 hypothetical protein DERF_014008 [Dermatophagoides farinae]KAH9526770.1 hypothetical protein DERF_000832 [Dermatophagoides farinae]